VSVVILLSVASRLGAACMHKLEEVTSGVTVKTDGAPSTARCQSPAVEDSAVVKFYFVNNPFCLSADDRVLISLASDACFEGDFSRSGNIRVSNELDRVAVMPILDIVKKGNLHYSMHRKDSFLWKREYRYLYIVFTPEEGPGFAVHFFPMETPAYSFQMQ
jgi:hypothetical protein